MSESGPELWRPNDDSPKHARLVFAVVLILAFCGFFAIRFYNRASAADAAITAETGSIGLTEEGEALHRIHRAASPELWYRVTLGNSPFGAELTLNAEWFTPNGTLAQRNQYTTKPIDKSPWPTHARFKLAADAPTGQWKVRLLLHGRELRSDSFEVIDEKQGPP